MQGGDSAWNTGTEIHYGDNLNASPFVVQDLYIARAQGELVLEDELYKVGKGIWFLVSDKA